MAISHRHLILSVVGFSYYISPATAGSALCVLFKSSPQWNTLTTAQQRCTTGNVSPAWTAYSCNEKACFCNDPAGIDKRLMDCVLKYISGDDDPLDAYNGAMHFYATECGTFQFQKKDYLSQSVTFSRTYATSAPAPGSNHDLGATPTTDLTQQNPAPTGTKSGDSGQGSAGSQSNSNPDLSVGGIIGIVAGVCTILALFVAIYMCWCK